MTACGGIVAGGPGDGGARSNPGLPNDTANATSSAVVRTTSTSTSTRITPTFSASSITRAATTTTTVVGTFVIDDMAAASGAQIDMSPRVRAGLPNGASPGAWYSFTSDVPTSVLPNQNAPFFFTAVSPPPGVASTHGACLTSPGFVGFYAGEGFQFAVSGGTPAAFDTRPYRGVRFWVIGIPYGGAVPVIKIDFPDDQTSSAVATSACNVNVGQRTPGQCDDNFADQAEPLTTSWTQIGIRFSALAQGGYGGPAGTFVSWDAAHVYGMNFQVNGVQADAGNPSFSFCIADIEFVP
jgi:hypothetical protein